MDGLTGGGGLFLAQQAGEEHKHAAVEDSRAEESGLAVRVLSWLLVDAEASWAICTIRAKIRSTTGN